MTQWYDNIVSTIKTALEAVFIKKSNTAGLVKNDGSIVSVYNYANDQELSSIPNMEVVTRYCVLKGGTQKIVLDDGSRINQSTFATSGHTHTGSELRLGATGNDSNVTIQEVVNSKANINDIPTKTSDLTNNSGFLTSHNPIDNSLSSSSTNAVQNKIINNALNDKADSSHTHNYQAPIETEHTSLHQKFQLYKFGNVVTFHVLDWTPLYVRNEYAQIATINIPDEYKPPHTVIMHDAVTTGNHILIGDDGKVHQMITSTKSDYNFNGQITWITYSN